ncbi:MAG: hypothetical protein NVS2B3_18600 [Vulcanimicrobiaceae bacterium]
MQTSIGVYEAKTKSLRSIERVIDGERILVTRNGVPVAEPHAPPRETSTAHDVVAAFAAFRARQHGKGALRSANETLRDLAHEGHGR